MHLIKLTHLDQMLLDLMAFREHALRLILDLSSTVITLLVSDDINFLFPTKVFVNTNNVAL